MPLTPAQRTQRARIGAFELHAQRDPRITTASARAASPGQLPYWERIVDPEGQLEPPERTRRAEFKRRAHFARLALKSAQSRRAKAAS
jgi:hypothetical protein